MAEDAMEYFASQGRKPSFDARGRVRGFRSRPGAPQANTQGGVAGATNAMSAMNWVGKFKNTGAQVRAAAVAEKGAPLGVADFYKGAGATGAAAPAGAGGMFGSMLDATGDVSASITGQTLDALFGQPGYWNRLVGRPVATTSLPTTATGLRPSISTSSGAQGIVRRVEGLSAGQSASASFVPGQNSAANLAKRRAPFSWSSVFANG